LGFWFDVMFIDSLMDCVNYVRDVQVCVERMICYIPGCIFYASENFGLGSLLAKLEEAITGFVMSACLSLRMEQLGSHWTDFRTFYMCIFRKCFEKQIRLSSQCNKINPLAPEFSLKF
jgi:hypothetical protein